MSRISLSHITPYIFIFLLGLGLNGCVEVPMPIESHYNRGVELYDEEKYTEAIEVYQQALRLNPQDSFAKYNLAVVYQDQGKHDKAIPIYKEILKSFEDTNSRINLAAAYNAQGQRDLAYQELKTAIEKNPDNPKPYSVLGRYQELDGSYKEAENNYKKALKIDDKHAVSHFRLGRYLCSQHRPNVEGLEHLKKAVELEPEVPEFLEELGMEYKRIEEFSDSADMLERLSVLQPDRGELFVLLGDLYKKIKFYQKAVERYWSALEFNDDNQHVHQSLRDIYQELLRIEEAKLKTSF